MARRVRPPAHTFVHLPLAQATVLAQQVAVVDNVLPPSVVHGLLRFSQDSTLFMDLKAGHLGAYLRDGFAPGLALQVGVALRERLPRLLGPHLLHTVWTYKFDAEHNTGIRAHRDQGAVSVNCWLTPDSANLDPATGGLVLHRLTHARVDATAEGPSPELGDFTTANQDFRRLQQELAQAHEDPAVNVTVFDVPHRQNRCVVFRSDLLHETGPVRFRPGYRNRRINLTFMFGMSERFSPG